jgi:tetratricopeptide (TPR) repeat protein
VHAATSAGQLGAFHDRWLAEVADAPVAEQLSDGSGWGRVELRLRGPAAHLPTGALPFPAVDDDSLGASRLLDGEAADLLETLPVPPVSDRWRAVLDAAPDSAWVHLARAVNAQVRGERERAAEQYAASLAAEENPWALRGLALLAEDDARACELYDRARLLLPHSRGLAVEHLERLLAAGRPGDCLAAVAELPHEIRAHGRTRLLEAEALLAQGDRERADDVLGSLVVEDLAEGGTVLTDLWDALHPGVTPPAHLDFRMTGDDERSR